MLGKRKIRQIFERYCKTAYSCYSSTEVITWDDMEAFIGLIEDAYEESRKKKKGIIEAKNVKCPMCCGIGEIDPGGSVEMLIMCPCCNGSGKVLKEVK